LAVIRIRRSLFGSPVARVVCHAPCGVLGAVGRSAVFARADPASLLHYAKAQAAIEKGGLAKIVLIP